MSNLFTPPIDQHVEDREKRFETPSDDREVGFVLQTHPRGNGDLDEHDQEHGAERWDSVLGW